MTGVTAAPPLADYFGAHWEPMRIETKLTGLGDEVAKVRYAGMTKQQRGPRPLSPLSLPVDSYPDELASELQLLPKGLLDDFLPVSETPASSSAPAPSPEAQPPARGAPAALGCHVPDLVREAGRGNFAEVSRLLHLGEDPNGEDDFQLTALHGAAKKGHAQIVALLLERRAKVNARAAALHGETPLHYAAKYGHAGVVRMLLRGGADPTVAAEDGRIPLQYAQGKGHAHVETVLLNIER
mmetsp:Transcript_97149/g.299425  ORF Transcript_97149/g.299425 Transcript_97149/m.299425 type:complete len:240 (+) Transcript_97149:63-782(+)